MKIRGGIIMLLSAALLAGAPSIPETSERIRNFYDCDLVYKISAAKNKGVVYVAYQKHSDGEFRLVGSEPPAYQAYAYFRFSCAVDGLIGMAGRAGDQIAALQDEQVSSFIKPYDSKKPIFVYVRSKWIGVPSMDTAVPIEKYVPEFDLSEWSIIGISDDEFGRSMTYLFDSPDNFDLNPNYLVKAVASDAELTAVDKVVASRVSDTKRIAEEMSARLKEMIEKSEQDDVDK